MGPRMCRWPTTSSRDAGRISSARGLYISASCRIFPERIFVLLYHVRPASVKGKTRAANKNPRRCAPGTSCRQTPVFPFSRKRKQSKIRFLPRRVRGRKHFSPRKCASCPPKADKECAQRGEKTRRQSPLDFVYDLPPALCAGGFVSELLSPRCRPGRTPGSPRRTGSGWSPPPGWPHRR